MKFMEKNCEKKWKKKGSKKSKRTQRRERKKEKYKKRFNEKDEMKGFDCGSANTACHSIYVRLKKVRFIIIQKPLISAIFSVFDLNITQ